MLWAWALGMAMGAGVGAFIGAELMLLTLRNPLAGMLRAYRKLLADIRRLVETGQLRRR